MNQSVIEYYWGKGTFTGRLHPLCLKECGMLALKYKAKYPHVDLTAYGSPDSNDIQDQFAKDVTAIIERFGELVTSKEPYDPTIVNHRDLEKIKEGSYVTLADSLYNIVRLVEVIGQPKRVYREEGGIYQTYITTKIGGVIYMGCLTSEGLQRSGKLSVDYASANIPDLYRMLMEQVHKHNLSMPAIMELAGHSNEAVYYARMKSFSKHDTMPTMGQGEV